MLTTIFLTVFALLQDPAFTWSAQTDQDYWRAVHLLEVDGDPSQAADLFLEIAAGDAVAAAAGQAAFVRARGCQALSLAGRATEAGRLEAEIRAQAAGTLFEPAVARALAAAARQPQDPAKLDPDFLRLLRAQIGQEGGDGFVRLDRYGRRMQPYLLQLLSESLGPLAAEIQPGMAGRVLHLCFAVADDSFVQQLLPALAKQSGGGLGVLFAESLGAEPIDAVAKDAVDSFLLSLSHDPDVLRARVAVEALAGRDLEQGTERTRARLREILASSDDLLAPFIVPRMRHGKDGFSPLLLDAGFAAQMLVAEEARAKAFTAGELEMVARFAQDGRVLDERRLAWILIPSAGSNTHRSRSLSDGSKVEFKAPDDVRRDLHLDDEAVFGTRRPGGRTPVDLARWQERLHQLCQSDDPWTQELAALAVVGHGDWPLVDQLIRNAPAAQALDLVRSLPEDYPASLDDALTGRVTEGVLGEVCAIQLLNQAERLSYEQASRLDQLTKVEAKAFRRLFQRWSETASGQAELERWGRSADQSLDSRAETTQVLARTAPERLSYCFDLLASDGLSENWEDQIRSHLLNRWSRTLPAPAAQRGALSSEDVDRMVYLGRLMFENRERHGRITDWCNAVIQLLEQGTSGSFEIFERVLADPAARGYFLEGIGFFRHQPQESARVARLLIGMDLELVQHHLFDLLRSGEGEEVAFAILESVSDAGLVVKSLNRLATGDRLSVEREDFVAAYLEQPDYAAYTAEILARKETNADRVPAMIAAWRLPGVQVRAELIAALGATLDERVVPALLEALADRDELVAETAAVALDRLKRLREERQAWEAWQRFGMAQSPTAALLGKLGSDKAEVRLAAIASLGTLQAAEALPFLIELLEDDDPATAEAARKALAKINAD